MKRMKTFLTYVLLVIGFFALSIILENALLLSMYSKISGEFDGYYSKTNSKFGIHNVDSKSCSVNGYINFDLINSTGKYIENEYLKVELYNKQNLLADTEYFIISNMQPWESKTFKIKFTANNIKYFKMSIVSEVPDKSNIVNILGWDVDLTNVFGLGIDLSNLTIFGKNIKDIINWVNIKTTGRGIWIWFLSIASGIPRWAYLIGWMFIVGIL
jgi:hypothetical protein